MVRKNASEQRYEPMPPVEGPAEPYGGGKHLSIEGLVHILRKRKWIPVGCVVGFVAVAAIGSFKATPMYRATAQIEIESESLNVVPFEDVVKVNPWHIDSYYNTQYKILKSRTLAAVVAGELRQPGSELSGREKERGHLKDAEMTRDRVLGMTKIEPVRNSRLVEIIAESPDAEQAARVANTLADAYIEQDLNKRVATIGAATAKLEKELATAKEDVDKSEAAFTKYKQDNNIVSPEKEENLVLKELSKLNEAAAAASAERLTKETRYNSLRTLSVEELRHEEEVVGNELIRNLKLEEAKALRAVEELSQTYGEKHPKMKSAREKAAAFQKEIDTRIQKVVEEVKNGYLKAKKEEEQLAEAVASKNKEALAFNQKVNGYLRLQRELENKKKLYEEILRRGGETAISKETEESTIRIVDRAEAAKRPFRPRTTVNLALAVVLGLVVGCSGAFFVEHLSDKVENPEDVEVLLAKPFLGAVPVISKPYDAVEQRGRIAHLSPRSRTAEAYKTLLASIQYSPAADSLKTILVTSAGAAEGKTTTLTNLGIAAAHNGKNVLLVDCDLRRPTIHKIFGLAKEVGLTDYLIGEKTLPEVIQETGIPNLSAIPRGGASPNPPGLISSDRMKAFTKSIREKFDLVLFDSPPCTALADPLILANLMDAVINVTQSGKFSRKMVGRGIELLDNVNGNVLGVVLNEVKERDHRYYYYYGYSYYYGKEEEGSGKRRKSSRGRSRRRKR